MTEHSVDIVVANQFHFILGYWLASV